MKIVDVKMTPLFCRFKQPYFWAQCRHDGARLALIQVETDQGIVGYGEVPSTMMPLEPIMLFFETAQKI